VATLYVRPRTLPGGARRFDVKYRRGGRFTALEHGGTFRTRGEALTRRAKIAEWLAAGLNPKVELARVLSPARTVSELQAEWLAGKRSVGAQTLAGYRSRKTLIEREFGRIVAEELRVEDVVGWVGKLTDEYQPSTVSGYLGQLRMILDLLDGPNVARSRRVELPRMTRAEIDPPDADAVLALLGGLSEDVLYPVLAMEQLGSRVSETLALTRDDMQETVVRFRREEVKGKRASRLVPCSALVGQALAERVPFRLSRVTVWRKLTDASEIHPHLLRHRRGSLWHQQGVVAVELARRLGHAKASTSLDIYSHAKPLREIAAHDLASLFK
jgi:integrase